MCGVASTSANAAYRPASAVSVWQLRPAKPAPATAVKVQVLSSRTVSFHACAARSAQPYAQAAGPAAALPTGSSQVPGAEAAQAGQRPPQSTAASSLFFTLSKHVPATAAQLRSQSRVDAGSCLTSTYAHPARTAQ